MAKQKKFGAFAGVFTPSLLTILGVIMYMRLGWVVGHAGLIGAIAIVLLAHVISVSTGLSISSIATDKKVGAGGIYYVLSRSLGVPIGGAIGIALYVGTAFSIALYLIGFAESFNAYFGFDVGYNGLVITGTVALLSLTAIALISTSFALKTQFFILAAIVISLVAIFFGNANYEAPEAGSLPIIETVPMAAIFAVFFPAVTGFTAGIAMSGDLKDPKKSIPFGTLAAIAVGLIVYVVLAIFIAQTIPADVLKSDYNILSKVAFSPEAVSAGIWGATLSSALGGILGGPRILQAMSIDRITWPVFAKGKGENNEPINALILVFVIAQLGILIGELDMIARVVSMFYLSAYGFINISFFLESWANSDFRPKFKVSRWFGLIGAIACFGVMFQLDVIFMAVALMVIGGLYYWLKRKAIDLGTTDVWQSVWNNIVAKGLKRLETQEANQKNWNPNIILFSGDSNHRKHLLTFSKIVSGKTGLVTNFNLIDAKDSDTPQSKNDQIIKDTQLEALGIFGRQIAVDNVYTGIENIASTFGFSGVEPNTVMMGWAKNTQNPSSYAMMTQKLMDLDYNILYLDYDERYGMGQKETIDLWWRDAHNNAELMLNICRFIKQSPDWANAKIRILFVNQNNADSSIVKLGITKLLEKVRTEAEIKIINNGVDQKPIYKIIEQYSIKSDMVLLGIPNVESDKTELFVKKTNKLFESIGTTLLVKASQDFNALDLDFSVDGQREKIVTELVPLVATDFAKTTALVEGYDQHLSASLEQMQTDGFEMVSNLYQKYIHQLYDVFKLSIKSFNHNEDADAVLQNINIFYQGALKVTAQFDEQTIPVMQEKFDENFQQFLDNRSAFVKNQDSRVKVDSDGKSKNLDWKSMVQFYNDYKINAFLSTDLGEFIQANNNLLYVFRETTIADLTYFTQKILASKNNIQENIDDYQKKGDALFEKLLSDARLMSVDIYQKIKINDRAVCNQIAKDINKEHWNVKEKLKLNKGEKANVVDMAQNINSFGENLTAFQKLFQNHNKVSLHLGLASNKLSKIHLTILNHLKQDVIEPQKEKINTIGLILEDIEKGNKISNTQREAIAQHSNIFSLTNLLENEEERILAVSNDAPLSVELLEAEAYRNVLENAGLQLDTFNIELAKIQDYIIKTNYTYPLQNILLDLQKSQAKNEESLQHLSLLTKQLIEDGVDFKQENGIEMDEVVRQVNLAKIEVDAYEDEVKNELSLNLNQTVTDLNIKSIMESIDSLNEFANSNDYSNKLNLWFKDRWSSVKKSKENVKRTLQYQRRASQLERQRSSLNKYVNVVEDTARFVHNLQPRKSVLDQLSIYYTKLFSGSHLGEEKVNSWTDAYLQAEVFKQRHEDGKSGALMVIGGAQIGKTFFTRTIANTYFEGEKFTLNLSGLTKVSVEGVKALFKKAFNTKGDVSRVLATMPGGKVFVINDIEKLWIRSVDGQEALKYLIQLIEKYGSKHVFLLNANQYSYSEIRQNTNIDKVLLANIVLTPLKTEEIGNVILKRHSIADGYIKYNNDAVKRLSADHRLFAQISRLSDGHIGVALSQWLSLIDREEDTFILQRPTAQKWDLILEPHWKMILFNLHIHDGLSTDHIDQLFAESTHTKVYKALTEMVNSGLVVKTNSGKYKFLTEAKYFVEKLLIDQNLIK